MSDVIASQPSLLQMISRFGIQLGVGEKTVSEVCEASKVDTTTFLAVANVMKQGAAAAGEFYQLLRCQRSGIPHPQVLR